MTITETRPPDTEPTESDSQRPPMEPVGKSEPAAPVVDIPLSEASQELNGYEVTAIERHFGTAFEDLSGTCMVMGCIWAYEGRTEGKAVSWARVNAMTVRRMSSYFAPEPKDAEEAEAAGKE